MNLPIVYLTIVNLLFLILGYILTIQSLKLYRDNQKIELFNKQTLTSYETSIVRYQVLQIYYRRKWYISMLRQSQFIINNPNDYEIDQRSYIYFVLGEIYFMLNSFTQAINNYKLASKLLPNKIPILERLGATYKAIRDYKLAKLTYLEALKLNPDNMQIEKEINSLKYLN
uniref:Uncharacterized protein n=1 Tax=Bangiopsis subsimplex TaxID=139980 RepID=A0A1C9CCM8_9RHOD|nr:hypothetical protein Bangp_047 [Bangiopsis subsimplex]AOM66129.1 hypothetical protein Bangp_047 [Bangiopsis subsimplex]